MTIAQTESRLMVLRRSRLLLLAAIVLLLEGCDGGSNQSKDDTVVSQESPRQGSIRVVNVIEDGPTLTAVLRNVVADSESAFGSVAYAHATALTKTLVGQYEMDVGYVTPSGSTERLVDSETIDLTDPDEVSLFLLGQLSDFQVIRLDEVEMDYGVDSNDSSTWPEPQIRIFDASRRADRVAVYVTASKVPIVNAVPLAVVEYGDVTDLQSLDSSTTYRVRVTKDGSRDVIFDSGDFTLGRITRTVLLIYDQFVPGGVELRVTRVASSGTTPFANDPSQAALRFTDLVADVPSVDVYFGDTADTPIFSNVNFGSTTPYVKLDAGTYNVNITPTGVQNRFVYQGSLTIVSASVGTLYASGNLSDEDVGVASKTFEDDPRSVVSQVALHFINGAGSAGSVDVFLLAPGQPYEDAVPILNDGALLANATTSRDPAQYDLIVTDSSGREIVYGPQRLNLELGGTYRAMLVDSPGGGTPLTLLLERDETSP